MKVETFSPEDVIKEQGIVMTAAAIEHVRKQMKKQEGSIGLRLRIKTVGCSGKSYKPEIAMSIEENELSFHVAEDVQLLVKRDDFFNYLKNLTIDFERKGINAIFKYINPNEKGSCGCGESFSF